MPTWGLEQFERAIREAEAATVLSHVDMRRARQ
jgi:hypothetical protein